MKNNFICLLAVSAILACVAGCGGNLSNVATSEASGIETTVQPFGLASFPTAERRGIQSLYFGKLSSGFVTEIDTQLKKAATSTPIEIAFCVDNGFTNESSRWANPKQALSELSGRSVILTTHFGHHTMSKVKSPAGWADEFYTGIFRDKFDDAFFVVSPANEEDATDNFSDKARSFLNQLVARWKSDPARKATPFPYNRIHVRNYGAKVGTPVSGFGIENEIHIPDNTTAATSFPGGNYTIYSNDGQSVNEPAYNNHVLGNISLANFSAMSKNKNVILWNPILHMWRYDSGDKRFHADGARAETSGSPRTQFLNDLGSFMKSL